MTTTPLAGMRVIELTTAWAGPVVGRLLGALGAEVIKVEAPNSLDIWRGPFPLNWGTRNIPEGRDRRERSVDVAPNFNSVNRNKYSLALDLSTDRGRELFLDLVRDAHVVVANLTERVLPNLKLTYEDLRAVNPRVILVNMPALGASGPYKGAAGYGSIIEGMGGAAARFGYRHEDARVSPSYFPDPVAGIHASLAVMAALRRGESCLIDLSQQETMWMQLGEGIVLASQEAREPGRLGNAEPRCSPSGVYPVANGEWIAVVVRDESEFAALISAGGGALDAIAAWSLDRRLAERDAVDGVVASWTSGLGKPDALARLRRAGVSAGPVHTFREAVRDELGAAFLEEIEHPVCGVQQYQRIPVRVDGQTVASTRHAPPFDHDTDDVLTRMLGLHDDELADLRDEGVTGGIPSLLRDPDD